MMLSVTARCRATVPCAKPCRIVSTRRRTMVVAARSKGEIEDEFQAQQDLLELRRQKAENKAARQKPAPEGATLKPEKPSSSAARSSDATPTRGEPNYAEESAEANNPLGTFMGRLFGRKK